VEVREVRPTEYQEAGALVVAAYRALPGPHVSDGYSGQLSDVERRASEAEVLVAVEGGLLGCVTFVPDATSPWAELLHDHESGIRMLAVDPKVQSRGVGRALLRACLDRAGRIGQNALFLHSTPWMHAARHLYVQAGFVRVPDRDWLPVPDVPLLAFRRELTLREQQSSRGPGEGGEMVVEPSKT
jgi:ribosomal protein S18 acetylase RimI-like enzyme